MRLADLNGNYRQSVFWGPFSSGSRNLSTAVDLSKGTVELTSELNGSSSAIVEPYRMEVLGDINGDSIDDLLILGNVLTSSGGATSYSVTLLWTDGFFADTTLSDSSWKATLGYPGSIFQLGDIQKDGYDDFAIYQTTFSKDPITQVYSTNYLYEIVLGDGNNAFTSGILVFADYDDIQPEYGIGTTVMDLDRSGLSEIYISTPNNRHNGQSAGAIYKISNLDSMEFTSWKYTTPE